MKRAKVQVVVRMVSPGLPAEQMSLENEFPYQDARIRYHELLRKVFKAAQQAMASEPTDVLAAKEGGSNE
jgi:hypothetical protein